MNRIVAILVFIFSFLFSKAQIISTIAGDGAQGYFGNGGQATAAEIFLPYGVAADNSGDFFIADEYNNVIREVNSFGIIYNVAGNHSTGYSGDGGSALSAELTFPTGVSIDASGRIYIADYGNSAIRMVNTSGIISSIAGFNFRGYSGDGGPATAAELYYPYDVQKDASGNIYIADTYNNVIRKINTSGIISTIAGNYASGHGYSGDGGPASTAELGHPVSISIDVYGKIYIADLDNYVVRMVDNSGIIHTVAGNHIGGFSGDGGQATAAEIKQPWAITVDASDNIFITDAGNGRIRKVNSTGIITTISGTNLNGHSGDGGPATAAELYDPTGICHDASGNLYFSEQGNVDIRKITNSSCSMVVGAFVTNSLSCYGGNNAAITASPSGGTSPYTYLWNPGGKTNANVSGLSAGNYTVSVSDKNGCSGTAFVTIIQGVPLRDSISVFTCTLRKVYATVGVKGGTTPYTYLWSPLGTTNASVSGASNGTYTITVTDKSGCSSTMAHTFLCSHSRSGNMDDTAISSGIINNVIVYPNPSNGFFTVVFGHPELVSASQTIEVYNVLGEKVYSQFSASNSEFTIDLRSKPNGIYFYRVLKDNGSLLGQGKIVLQK